MQVLILAAAGVLVLGMTAQWLAWRLRAPSILLLLAFGFIAGQFLRPDDLIAHELLFPFVSLAVGAILLEGGLSLGLREIVETRWVVMRLCSLGALVAWVLTTVFARYLAGLDWSLSLLLGAILVVTGPTVIGPLLRHIRPVRSVGAIAKWEGIVVDPIGASLAVLVFQAVTIGDGGNAGWAIAGTLALTVTVGLLGGYAAAKVVEQLFYRHWVPDFLHSPILLSIALAAFALSNTVVPESGLLTVTVLGIALANQKRVSLEHIVEFKENLRVLLLSSLFIVLSARIEIADLRSIGWPGVLFVAALVLVVRPASIMASTAGTRLPWKHRAFLCGLAPRGIVAAAVSSVFAFEIAEAAHGGRLPEAFADQASAFVALTFVVIVGTVAFYSLLAGPLARRLGLASAQPQGILFAGAAPWVIDVARILKEVGTEVFVVDTNPDHISQARMAGVPALRADILSRYVNEDLELFGLGRFLAVTPNFEVNALACREYIREFERSNVYQLQIAEGQSQRSDLSHRLVGRPLFAKGITHDTLEEWSLRGARAKKTKLTEKFGYEDLVDQHAGTVIPLFLLSAQGKLTVVTSDTPEPPAGATLISLALEGDLRSSRPKREEPRRGGAGSAVQSASAGAAAPRTDA